MSHRPRDEKVARVFSREKTEGISPEKIKSSDNESARQTAGR
jgi:hypothetical protein